MRCPYPRNPGPGQPVPVQDSIFIFAMVMMALTLLSPILGWALRRWYGVDKVGLTRIPGAARWTLWSAALLFLLSLVVIIIGLETDSLVRSRSPALWLIFLPPILAAVPTLFSVGFAVFLWLKRQGRPMVRVSYALATIGFCVLLWQMNVWNVLGWHY